MVDAVALDQVASANLDVEPSLVLVLPQSQPDLHVLVLAQSQPDLALAPSQTVHVHAQSQHDLVLVQFVSRKENLQAVRVPSLEARKAAHVPHARRKRAKKALSLGWIQPFIFLCPSMTQIYSS